MPRRAARLLACSALALTTAAEAGETVTYDYDALGRLTATTGSGSVNNGVATGIAYDPAGNRSAYTVSGATGTPPPPEPPPPPAPPQPSPPPPSNQPPVAVSDSFQVQRCTATTFDVLANDSDPNGDPLTLTSVSGQAAQVGVMGIANNRLSWSSGYSSGAFPGSYTVSDGRGGTATGGFTVQIGPGGC